MKKVNKDKVHIYIFIETEKEIERLEKEESTWLEIMCHAVSRVGTRMVSGAR